jgi:hypothetical protein
MTAAISGASVARRRARLCRHPAVNDHRLAVYIGKRLAGKPRRAEAGGDKHKNRSGFHIARVRGTHPPEWR